MQRFVVRKIEKTPVPESTSGDAVYREIRDGLGYEIIDNDTGDRVAVHLTERDANDEAMQLNA